MAIELRRVPYDWDIDCTFYDRGCRELAWVMIVNTNGGESYVCPEHARQLSAALIFAANKVSPRTEIGRSASGRPAPSG